MSQFYIEYTFTIDPLKPGSEILMAELAEVGFESFVETEDGLLAYIQKNLWHQKILENIQLFNNGSFAINFRLKEIEPVNWNEEWEKNFEPITVDGLCTIRAPFHAVPKTPFDIVIEPKMSFGTGHHETTHMMVQHLLKLDLTNKKILDMGCGTAVLAILAQKKGAKPVDAIDIDHWCYLNSLENIERNQCSHVSVLEGDATLLTGKKYDVILANINRNILLNDIPIYTECLNPNGTLLLSGFYNDDIPTITERCAEFGLNFGEKLEKNFWVALKFLN